MNKPQPAASARPLDFTALDTALTATAAEIDAALEGLLPRPSGSHGRVQEAMRYAVFAGGKRLRPFLVRASAGLFGISGAGAMRAGAAVEVLHTYSLVHAGQVVMDEGIGVQHLDSGTGPHRRRTRDPEQTGRGPDQEGPQPLAAGEDRVAHGLLHPAVEAVGLGQDGVQGLIDLGRRLANSLREGQAKGPRSAQTDDAIQVEARSCSVITNAMGLV